MHLVRACHSRHCIRRCSAADVNLCPPRFASVYALLATVVFRPSVVCPSQQGCTAADLHLSMCTDQTGQYSIQIFSLAVLLSSLFVYNQMGGIDDAALDSLALVTEMSKHIATQADTSEHPSQVQINWVISF